MTFLATEKIDVEGCPHDYFYIAPVSIQAGGLLYSVNRCGYAARTSPNFHVNRNDSYPFHVLHCVRKGSGGITYRGENYPVSAGSFFLLEAHEPHSYFADPKDPMDVVWIEFLGGDSDRLVRHILDTLGPVYGKDIFLNVLQHCERIALNPKRSPAEISRDIHGLLAAICAHCTEIHEMRNPMIKLVLAYIDKHLSDKLALYEVAQALGYHPAYLSDRFSKVMGRSYGQYVHQRKINHACYLLMTTGWPIDRIGQELGFYDVSHFTRRFKEVTGMTPSSYRRVCK